MLAKRSSFGDFTPGNGRTRCKAKAKTTGARCRCDAIGGTTRCKAHGGIAYAMRKLRQERGAKAQRRRPDYHARRALFAVSLESPEGFVSEAVGIERGKQIEKFKNLNDCVGLSKKDER